MFSHNPDAVEEQPKPSEDVDVNVILLQQLHDAVQAVYAECRQTPPPRAVTADAGQMYNDLRRMGVDLDDEAVVAALIPVLRQRFKDRISKAEPGSSKAVAS